jgi:hypothetical protein
MNRKTAVSFVAKARENVMRAAAGHTSLSGLSQTRITANVLSSSQKLVNTSFEADSHRTGSE